MSWAIYCGISLEDPKDIWGISLEDLQDIWGISGGYVKEYLGDILGISGGILHFIVGNSLLCEEGEWWSVHSGGLLVI